MVLAINKQKQLKKNKEKWIIPTTTKTTTKTTTMDPSSTVATDPSILIGAGWGGTWMMTPHSIVPGLKGVLISLSLGLQMKQTLCTPNLGLISSELKGGCVWIAQSSTLESSWGCTLSTLRGTRWGALLVRTPTKQLGTWNVRKMIVFLLFQMYKTDWLTYFSL